MQVNFEDIKAQLNTETTVEKFKEDLFKILPDEETHTVINEICSMPDYMFDSAKDGIVEEFKKIGQAAAEKVEIGLVNDEERRANASFFLMIGTKMATMKEFGENKRYCLGKLFDSIAEAILSYCRPEITVPIEIGPNGKLPEYANPTDAGADVYAAEEVVLKPGETKVVKTALKVAIPDGYMINVYPRSGLSLKTPLRIANSVGVIDTGYRDECGVICWNSSTTESFKINLGDRIAQFVIMQTPKIAWKPVDDITKYEGDRGGGFGSSGAN